MSKRPYITISYAQSLDGRIATATGDSQYISGAKTLRLAHKLRRDNQGILVGIGTVIKDDPLLTCRLHRNERRNRNPLRIILDSHLRIPSDSRIVDTAPEVPTLIFTTGGAREERVAALRETGVRIECIESSGNGRVSLGQCMQRLFELGVHTLFVEGGSAVITGFLEQRLVDKMLVVTAPLIIGEGIPAVGDLGITGLQDARAPRKVRGRRYGNDYVWELIFDEHDDT